MIASMAGSVGTVLATIPSPPQGVWYVGPVALRAYAICIIAGIVVAVWWGNKRFVARGGRRGRVTDISVFAVPFGIVGGRIYHVITDNQLYFGEGRNPWNAFAIWNGGLGIWGAIAFGAVGAWIGCRVLQGPAVRVRRLGGARHRGRAGDRPARQLLQPGAVRRPDHRAVGPGGLRPDPGRRRRRDPGDGNCEFPTDYVKATPEVLCGVYQPTFLYELLWCVRGGCRRRLGRQAVPAGRRPGVRHLRRRIHAGPDLDRDAAHRPGEPRSSGCGSTSTSPRRCSSVPSCS